MLAGTVYFLDDFKNSILEMDIDEFSKLSTRELFDKILEIDAKKVIVKGFTHNHQSKPYEAIIYSERY